MFANLQGEEDLLQQANLATLPREIIMSLQTLNLVVVFIYCLCKTLRNTLPMPLILLHAGTTLDSTTLTLVSLDKSVSI